MYFCLACILAKFYWSLSCTLCVIVCVCIYVYSTNNINMYKYYSVDQVLGYVAQVAYCGLLLRSYLGEADVVGDLNIFDV